MRPATPEERKRFYREEWSRRDLPDFILHTLSLREFGFDLDGSGPSHRYNQFMTPEQLEDFMRFRAPYSAYASVALYEKPRRREGWIKAELVFDIDAKDLPLKPCGCPQGQVCERCIEEAKRVAGEFADVLRGDLGFRNLSFVYSGRGFHVRVFDEAAMLLEQNERAQLVNYITGGVVPSDLTMALGYSKVFRERAAKTLERLDENRLRDVIKSRQVFQKLVQFKDQVIAGIRQGKMEDVLNLSGIGVATIERLLEFLERKNSELTDG